MSEAKNDSGKLQLSLVPPEIITAIAEIRRYGTEKYHDPENWRQVDPQRYWDALLRHTLAAWDDYNAVDPESGMPHIWHIACNLAFIMAMKEPENYNTGEQSIDQAEQSIDPDPVLKNFKPFAPEPKMKPEMEPEIRKMLCDGNNVPIIAKHYNVSDQTVRNFCQKHEIDYKARKDCQSCQYRGKVGSKDLCCDFMSKTGHTRGDAAGTCTHYKAKE